MSNNICSNVCGSNNDSNNEVGKVGKISDHQLGGPAGFKSRPG